MNQPTERQAAIRGCGRGRRGFALVEMFVVLVVLALIVLIVTPKAYTAMVKSDLRSARVTLMAQINRGKIAAIHKNRRATVILDAGRIWIETSPRQVPLAGSTADTVGTIVSLTSQFGVTVTPATAAISFDPRGIGTDPTTPVTFALAKDGLTTNLTVNGLGRIIQ